MESAADLLLFVALLAAIGLGGLLAVFQLPGTWVIVAATVGYAWYYDFVHFGWGTLAIMGGIAGLAEIAEILSGMRGAARAGASRGASWGALLGGFAGILLFTPMIPVPIVGSILGGLIGCFAGAYIMECRVHGDRLQGSRVARSAVVGRLIGLLIKMAAAVLLAGVAVGCGVLVLRSRLL